MAGPRDTAYRRDGLWRAAMVHRVSGVLLACFLPLHFLTLGLAIEGAARLDQFLNWSQTPLVKAGEVMLVLLLTVHLLGGLRILAVENLPWRAGQRRRATLAIVTAIAVAAAFAAYAV